MTPAVKKSIGLILLFFFLFFPKYSAYVTHIGKTPDRRVYQHGIHLRYERMLKSEGIVYRRFPDLRKDKDHVGK